MKKIISLSILSLALSAPAFGAPFMAIGEGAELFVTGTVGVRTDDNILLSQNEVDDLIFEVTPGLEFTFGKDAQMKGALITELEFTNYSDHSNLDSELFSGLFSSKYDDGKLKLAFNLSFVELAQNTVEIRPLTIGEGRVRRDIFDAGANAELEISQLTSIGAGLNYNRQNYKRAGYSDFKTLTIPLDFFYKITPKADLSFGYRYRDNDLSLAEDSNDHFFSVGARGEFTPKLTGRFAAGLSRRTFDTAGNENMFGLDASLAYELTPKTNLQVGISNDFGTSPQGNEQKNFTINGALVTKVSEEWTFNAGLSYRRIDYYTRKDDYIEGNLGAAYVMNANVRLIGAYAYRTYDSELAGSDFTNNVFSIAANLRY